MNESNVLALYDFASKQEYIYRTSKIKEISGASALMTDMYRKFVCILKKEDITLKYELKSEFLLADFASAGNNSDGEVLYDGGGNLMVIWKSAGIYNEANRVLSTYLLINVPGLKMITCCVPVSGDFEKDRTELYRMNALKKNRFPAVDMPPVTPFTQIDAMTFLPVTNKIIYKDGRQVSLSADRYVKTKKYNEDKAKSDLDEDEGMLAVIFIDGNSMGNKLIACKSAVYDDGVEKLRSFSEQINTYYVDEPLEAIKNAGYAFRKVIGSGDEITLMCKAQDAFKIMQEYFKSLKDKKILLSGTEFDCTSCAGIAVFHAKSPFNVAYDIAEAACEQAKEKAHENDGNYFSFYYCHGGVTNIFKILHNNEQSHTSGKPYAVDDMTRFDNMHALLNVAERANVKALGSAAQRSSAAYEYETKRVNAYMPAGSPKLNGSEDEMKLVYDMSEFYDLWFAKEDEKNEQNA